MQKKLVIRETTSPILCRSHDHYGHQHWRLWIDIKDRSLPPDGWEGTYLAIYETGDVHRVETDRYGLTTYLVGDFSAMGAVSPEKNNEQTQP